IEANIQALGRIAEGFGEASLDGEAIGVDLDEMAANLPGSVQIRVFDAAGRRLAGSAGEPLPDEIEEREYFAALRDGARSSIGSLLVLGGAERKFFPVAHR